MALKKLRLCPGLRPSSRWHSLLLPVLLAGALPAAAAAQQDPADAERQTPGSESGDQDPTPDVRPGATPPDRPQTGGQGNVDAQAGDASEAEAVANESRDSTDRPGTNGEESEVEDTEPGTAGEPAKESPAPEEPQIDAPEYALEFEMSLREAIDIAFRNNLDTRIERLNRQIALRNIVVEKAVFDPFFNADYSFRKSRNPTVSPLDFDPTNPVLGVRVNPFNVHVFNTGIQGSTPIGSTYSVSFVETRADNPEASLFALNPRYNTSVDITVAQPLLRNAWYRYNSAAIRQARNNYAISDHQYEFILTTTIQDAVTAYWELVFAHMNFESKTKALDVARQQLQIESQKERVGTIAPIDLVTVKSQLARRKTEYDDAINALEAARDELLIRINYTGRESLKDLWESGRQLSPFDNVMVVPTTRPRIELTLPDRNDALRDAFRFRPEYRQADLALRNRRIDVDLARNQLLPSLDVSGTWSQLGLESELSESIDGVERGRFYNWQVGVTFEVPLVYRGPIAQYRNARDELRKAEREKQRTENQIVLEVDQAIRNLEFAHRAVINLQELVQLQEALLRAERTKLRAGSSVTYTVTQIENDLIEIRAEELRAEADFENARATLDRATGKLLPRFGIEVR